MPVGGQAGNKNGARSNRMWGDEIKKAILANDRKDLRAIAEALIAKAREGDIQAIKEIGDRLDGRALQQIDANVDASLTIEVMRYADTPEGGK